MNETTFTIDTTINLVSIISISAILSPVLVTLITSIFNILYKRMEYRHASQMKKWENFYSECHSVFSELLSSCGHLLANSYFDGEILNTLALLYKAYSYADEQLASVLDIYYQKLDAWNNNPTDTALLDDVQSYTITLCREINRFLLVNVAGKRHAKHRKTPRNVNKSS